MDRRLLVGTLAALLIALAGCGDDEDDPSGSPEEGTTPNSETTPSASEGLDRVVKVDGDRGLYVRCAGSGSPTVVMEGGDGDTSDSYAFAEPAVSKVTRVCVYDRANLGQSDPAPGPRGLADLVGDLAGWLEAAEIPGPYVLVGTSGGGYITAGYAVEHPQNTAGLVLIDTAAPFQNPPKEIVAETDPANPENVEKRDYLQVEKDAWNARRRIGDIPVKVVSVKMRRNVERQKGWLVLSPRAEQIVVNTGHAVEEDDPELVIDVILDAVKEAREG
ncbi:MAG TPA: alpha/beta hydrolase [Thermoleophilaceae bacterium]|nr:alpha/beta hydrolase [Thermoleophilaceae bacterium]